MMRSCLSIEELACYVSGSLAVTDRAAQEAHVEACDRCQLEIAAAVRGRREAGSEPTLAEGSARIAIAATTPLTVAAPKPSAVPAPRKADYDELVTVDPEHYVVAGELARGGMGRIMIARDRRLGRQVAIKELLTESRDLRARFEREARITAKLQHPSIVNLLEAGAWPDGEPFYVMKLVTGESLDKAIARRETLAARLALLPNVIAAVDALA
jgi:anti-sigma factor RsiW